MSDNLRSSLDLDSTIIKEKIESTDEYTDENVQIRKWENNKDSDKYVCSIKTDNIIYTGILSSLFQRDGIGLNINKKKNEIYFGYFEKDVRSKHGIYFWPKTSECYYGFWRDNKKDNHGIYFWLNEKNNNDYQTANFDVYIGDFLFDKYVRGVYLVKDNNNFYLYYGNFDEDGKKNDENCFYYSINSDKVFKGKIKNDKLQNGIVAEFNNEEGNDDVKVVFCVFDKDCSVKKIKNTDEMDQGLLNRLKSQICIFRDVIKKEKSLFLNYYQRYKQIIKFIVDNVKDISVFDDTDKYPEMIKLLSGYNELNIYKKIEKALRDRDSSNNI